MPPMYLYVRWTFLSVPYDLGSAGPFHSRMESDPASHSLFQVHRMRELIVRQFDSKEALDAYWESVQQVDDHVHPAYKGG